MAVATYRDILKKDPQNEQAADGQVTATMRWVENFHVLTREGEEAADIAAPKLDVILPILDAGLTRAQDRRAADILAHIGWAHWLNWHIAEREFGPAAEQSFRQALEIDSSNVYANAMLGNWLLQTNGSMRDAFSHFATAVQGGMERPWVRTMQLGGLIYNGDPQARAELVRVVNDMRKNDESMDDGDKGRILSYNYNISPYRSEELSMSLSAVPPDEAWATYQWLDDVEMIEPRDVDMQQLRREYIHVSLLELSGQKQKALSQYKSLQAKLQKYPSYVLIHSVENAIARLAAN
jgi:hypothetical protein